MDSLSPGMGHNRGPGALELERAAELVTTANRWVTEREAITDSDMAGVAQGFVDQIRANRDELDAAKKAEKAPIQSQLDAVDTKYRDPLELLKMALDKVLKLSSDWLAREKKRIADEKAAQEAEARRQREEADRLRLEAEAAAKTKGADALQAELAASRAADAAKAAEKVAAKPAPKAAVRGDFSPRSMSLRTYWHARLIVGATEKETDANKTLVLKHYAKNRIARDAMIEACLKVAEAQAKVDKRTDTAPPGIEFWKEEKAS